MGVGAPAGALAHESTRPGPRHLPSPGNKIPIFQLVALFGSVRDEWMAADLASWLAPNRIYPGVADAVRAALAGGDEVYIVTTKQVGRGGVRPWPLVHVCSCGCAWHGRVASYA